jgi:cytochrome c oxidase assembly protein subunit 15
MIPASGVDSADRARPSYRRGPHWIALFAAVFTLPLLYVGGSVTTYRVGLAVPDWPSTFGINMFLYDFWNAPFGVRMEHTHRLYGAAVGLATMILAGWFLAFERRVWMKGLGILALLAVIVQGVLGGTRVTHVSTLLAAVHGCTGQAFFGLMIALSVLTGRDWEEGGPTSPDFDHLRRHALLVLVLIGGQVLLGSWLRHYGTRTALISHAAFAAAVWVSAMHLFGRIERRRASVAFLVPSARVLAFTATLQIVLGMIALIYLLPFDGTPGPVTFYQAVVRTGHQTNGALLLAAAVVLNLRATRHLAPATVRGLRRGEGGSAGGLGPAPLDLEAVR